MDDGEAADPPPPVKIFVGGLASATTPAALRAHAEAFGPLVDHVLMANRGFGFVTFADAGAAAVFLEVRGGGHGAHAAARRPPA
jgi:RNA recognition motif-containing protein